MADDNLLRPYRTNDSRSHNADPRDSAPASDPLAELARLIGQTDPFADVGRGQRTAQPPLAHDAPPVAGDWRQHVERPSYYQPAPPMADPEPYVAHPHAGHGHDAHFADHADPRQYHSHAAYHDDPHHAAAMHQPQAAYYPDEQTYDDPPGQGIGADHPVHNGGSRGRTLVLAGALVCCAVIGTAAAYGYRTFTSKPSSNTKTAPVIVADKSPSKIVPAATEQKSRTQERFTVQGSERLVPREEQPAPLPSLPSSRVAALPDAPPPVAPVQTIPDAPTSTGTTPPPQIPSVPAQKQAAPPPAPPAQTSSDTLNEPRRVRTVPIRPEGGDVSARPQSRTNNAKAAPSRNGPLSLDPGANQPSEPARAQRALTPPAPREGSPERVASAPANDHAGGYLVQVSSQRSESDARASYRGLQQKYPQLKSRQPVIRRASLGEKGTYYRAMIGPFGSSGEAEKFCGSLKSAGGQCLIVRN